MKGRFDDAAMFDTIAALLDALLDAKATPRTGDDDRTAAERTAQAAAEMCGHVVDHGPTSGETKLDNLVTRTRSGADGEPPVWPGRGVVTSWRRTTTEILRFPSWQAMTARLSAAGLDIVDSWGDFGGCPVRADSPEWIFLARRALSTRGEPMDRP